MLENNKRMSSDYTMSAPHPIFTSKDGDFAVFEVKSKFVVMGKTKSKWHWVAGPFECPTQARDWMNNAKRETWAPKKPSHLRLVK